MQFRFLAWVGISLFLGNALRADVLIPISGQPGQTAIGNGANKVRFVLLIDYEAAGIGEGIKKDAVSMNRWINQVFNNENFPSLKGRAIVDTVGGPGRPLTEEDVESYFQRTKIGSDETLFVYYSGHCAYDPNILGGHYLGMSGKNHRSRLMRWDLKRWMWRTSANLKILITDACGSFVPYVAPDPEFRVCQKCHSCDAKGADGKRIDPERAFVNLFFEQKGFVDINAAEPGQEAYGPAEIGGLFTVALTGPLCINNFDTIDSNRDGFVSWLEVFQEARENTKILHLEAKRRRNSRGIENEFTQANLQTPKAWAMPSTGNLNFFASDVSLEHNCTSTGEDCLHIRSAWEAQGRELLGKTLNFRVFFTDWQGKYLRNFDSAYFEGNYVSVGSDDPRIDYQRTFFDKTSHKIPVAQLHLEANGLNLARDPVCASIQIFDNGKFLGKSEPNCFIRK